MQKQVKLATSIKRPPNFKLLYFFFALVSFLKYKSLLNKLLCLSSTLLLNIRAPKKQNIVGYLYKSYSLLDNCVSIYESSSNVKLNLSKYIPSCVVTSVRSSEEIFKSYDLYKSCYCFGCVIYL